MFMSPKLSKFISSVNNEARIIMLSAEQLSGKSRVKEIANARHIAIYLIRNITEMSLPNIGKLFNRDHATVMSSIDNVESRIGSSATFEAEINELIKEIKE